jgi:hypothetical protein
MSLPFACRWTNGAFVPVPYYAEECRRVFEEGRLYRLEEVKHRSQASHNHQFVEIDEAWRNLPEKYVEKFPSSEHLRKWALIVSGYNTQKVLVFASAMEAQNFVALMADLDEYAVCEIDGAIVTLYRAKSQSKRAMGAREFQASKDAVLAEISRLLNVEVETLKANAGAAA